MTAALANGLFRGICVDNRDPRNLGRIRVQVPQILGTATSGWAFPAWSIHETTVWPQDRLPAPGDGVWVMFDSTSPDKMIWLAAFGGIDLINQPGFVPDIEFDSTIDINLANTPEWNQIAVFYGNLGSDGGIPNPSPEVRLQMKPLGDTEWTDVSSTPVVDPNTGAWSISYKIVTPGQVDYRAYFPGVGVYSDATSSEIPTDTATETTTSAPVLPTLYNGTGLTVTGTVKTTSGDPVTDGAVELWWRYTVGGDTSWKLAAGPSNVASGNYSVTAPALTSIGATEWRVEYSGPGRFLSSTSTAVAATVNLRPNSSLTKGAVTHTSAAFSWSAVSGATHYDVERQINGGAWATLSSKTTSTTVSNTGLSTDTSYGYRVRPAKQDPAGTWIYGSYSPTITMSTGHPEQRDTGATGWITVTAQYWDSHRLDVNAWMRDRSDIMTDYFLRQGYYSSDYGGEGYLGVIRYTGTRVRDAIIAECGGGSTGSARQSNGVCTAAEVSLKRGPASGLGYEGATVSIGFYTSTSTGTGSRPSLDGSSVGVTSDIPGTGRSFLWHDIGTAHGQRIGDAQANSIAIYRNSRKNYAGFDAGDLRLKWSWDYVSVAYAAPSWS